GESARRVDSDDEPEQVLAPETDEEQQEPLVPEQEAEGAQESGHRSGGAEYRARLPCAGDDARELDEQDGGGAGETGTEGDAEKRSRTDALLERAADEVEPDGVREQVTPPVEGVEEHVRQHLPDAPAEQLVGIEGQRPEDPAVVGGHLESRR